MQPASNRAPQPFTSLPLTPALVMLLLLPQSRCAGVPWGALPPTLSAETPTPSQSVSQRGTEPPPPLAPSGEAKSQASELQALHCTAKMETSFTPELLHPPLQNRWQQAEDAFHWGPFQQSVSKAGTSCWCYQRLETGLRAALLRGRASRKVPRGLK